MKKLLLFFIVLILSLGSVFAVAPNASNTVAYYNLSGLTNSLSSQFDLTNNGATSGATGIIGDAYDFDGTNDYMDVANLNPLLYDLSNNDISWSYWVNPDDLTDHCFICTADSDNTPQVDMGRYFSSGGYMRFLFRDDASNTVQVWAYSPINIGSWTHIAGTYNSSNDELSIYIDGVLINQTSGSLGTFNQFVSGDSFFIGAYGQGGTAVAPFYNGVMDEVSVFNYVLNSNEVDYLYASGSPSASEQFAFDKNYDEDLARDTVSYYELTDLTDNVGLNDLTNNGATSGATGIIGDAYDFPGGVSDNLVSSTFSISSSTEKTFSLWINPDAVTGEDYIIDFFNGVGQRYIIGIDSSLGTLKLYDGSTWHNTGQSYSTSTWQHLVFVLDSSSTALRFYYDGVNVYNQTVSARAVEKFTMGTDQSGNSAFYDGKIDEVAIFDSALTSDQVSDLYASGSPESNVQYPYLSEAESGVFSITVRDSWSNSDIVNVSVFNTPPPITTYTNTTGSVLYPPYNVSGTLYNFTVGAENYISRSYTDFNTSSPLIAELNQSQITFAGIDLLGNDVTANVTFSVEGDNSNPIGLSEGSYNVTATYAGYSVVQAFNVSALDVKTVNVTGLYNSLVNLTVTEYPSTSRNNFSGDSYVGSSVNSFLTTSGFALLPAIIGSPINISLGPISGLQTTNLSTIVTPNSSSYSFDYLLYNNNSLLITIYDADTQSLITGQNVDVNLVGSSVTYDFSTSDGDVYETDLNSDTYTLTVTTSNYSVYQSVVTLSSGDSVNVDVYLQSGVSNVTFTVTDSFNNLLSNSTVTVNRLINGSYLTVYQGITDLAGIVIAGLESNENYRVIVNKDNYETFTGDLTSGQSAYTIVLTLENTGAYTSLFNDLVYNTNYVVGNDSLYVTLITSSTSGIVDYFSITDGVSTTNVTGSPNGGSTSINFTNVTGSKTVYYSIKATGFPVFSWNETIWVNGVDGGDTGLDSGVMTSLQNADPRVKIVIGSIIMLLFVTLIGGATRSSSMGIIGGLMSIGLNHYFALWPQGLSLVSLVVGLVLLIADNSSGGRS